MACRPSVNGRPELRITQIAGEIQKPALFFRPCTARRGVPAAEHQTQRRRVPEYKSDAVAGESRCGRELDIEFIFDIARAEERRRKRARARPVEVELCAGKETAQQQVLVAEILIAAGGRAVANSLSTISDYNARDQLFRLVCYSALYWPGGAIYETTAGHGTVSATVNSFPERLSRKFV